MRLSKNSRSLIGVGIIACGAAFAAGWYSHGAASEVFSPRPLRLAGDFKYVSPLLACNFNATKAFPPSATMNNVIQAAVSAHQSQGDVEKASVFFADFSNAKWASVNGDQKYYPSSLGKVPIMITYMAMAESDKTVLNQKISYPLNSPNLNADQEIKPEEAIVPGQTYTVNDLINHMIKYSDNNAAQLLYDNANQNDLDSVYSNLQIPVNNQVTSSTLDFMTPQQYSIIFRTLYNATYLSRDDSENALNLMSQTSFGQGIVAGVPSSTVVAHKFGIVSFMNGAVVTERELHDCGIVYAPGHPYQLCIMTRGSSSLLNMENAIADISRTVYQAVESGT